MDMANAEILTPLLQSFSNAQVTLIQQTRLIPASLWQIAATDWQKATVALKQQGFRWCALWATEETSATDKAHASPFDAGRKVPPTIGESAFLVNACYEKGGHYLLLRTRIPADKPQLPSQTVDYPAANRAERHIQDLFGIVFTNHPDSRRWTRHQAWQADEYPLCKAFPVGGKLSAALLFSKDKGKREPCPPDSAYPFLTAQGTGVYEIPVGPVHAGIIEPGHFRFQAVGETVLNLEEHLGYVHKGVEKIAEGRDAAGLARLAGRVSGDTTVSHTWAACMALENAVQLTVPPRALALRAIMAERERIANHLGDVGAICNDVAFAFANIQFSRLRELWQRVSRHSFGHRFMMDCIIPGGVASNLTTGLIDLQQAQLKTFHRELDELVPILEQHAGLKDRLYTTGYLNPKYAHQLGCLGYVGRASGQSFDVRYDAPYPPYDQLSVDVPVLSSCDVEGRVQIRLAEIRVSLQLLDELLTHLPQGDIAVDWPFTTATTLPLPVPLEGLGIVEGWRGEIIAYVRLTPDGKVNRYYPRDPSWLNWPALELLIRDNIVPDFPVCNKSVNGSYSGHDL